MAIGFFELGEEIARVEQELVEEDGEFIEVWHAVLPLKAKKWAKGFMGEEKDDKFLVGFETEQLADTLVRGWNERN